MRIGPWMGVLLMGCRVDPGGDTRPASETSAHYPLDDTLTLNHVQVAGTHNSYHVAPEPLVTEEWGYTLDPLDVQTAEQGIRQLELDVHYDEQLEDFTVYHVITFDEETNCSLLSDCLGSLRS